MPPQVAPYPSTPRDESPSEDFTSGEHTQFMDHHDSHNHQEHLYHIDDADTHFKQHSTSHHYPSYDDSHYFDTQGYGY